MKRKHKSWLHAGLTLALLLTSLPLHAAFAADALVPSGLLSPEATAVPSSELKTAASPADTTPLPPGAETENLPIFTDDRVIQGVTNREDIYFETNASRRVLPGSYIELLYGHSPTLLPKRSTLTVLVDDVPLGSVYLDEGNRDNAKWRVDISSLPFKPGFHKLSLVAHMEMSSNICEDQNNASNWMRLTKDSVIHLNLAKAYAEADLSYYPSPFLEKGSRQPLTAGFVVPDDATESELTGLAQLSQSFAAQVPASKLNVKVYHESELTESIVQDKRLIWIGRADAWKTFGRSLTDRIAKYNPTLGKQGYISLAQAPWGTASTQLIVQGNADQVMNGSAMLTDSALSSQLAGRLVPIPDQLQPTAHPVKSAAPNKKVHTTLSEMGYSDLVVESMLVGTTRISYALPSEWELTDDVKLKLKFKHSKTLNFAQSVIAVRVNGVPVHSQHLNEETSEVGVLDLSVPKDLIGPNRGLNIDIGFQFSSSTSKEACAGGNAQIGNWAVVDADSYLSYNYRSSETRALQNMPSPFVSQGNWDACAIVVPSQPTTEELSALATVISTLGRGLKSTDGLSVYSAARPDLDTVLKDKHIIFVGSSDRMPPLLAGNANRLVRMEGKQLTPVAKDIVLLNALQQHSAWMELTPSPLNTSRSALIVSATEPRWLPLVPAALTSAQDSVKIQGKLAVIDERHEVHTFQIADPAKKPTIADQMKDALSVTDQTVLSRILIIAALVAVLLVVGLLLWFARKRKRRRKK